MCLGARDTGHGWWRMRLHGVSDVLVRSHNYMFRIDVLRDTLLQIILNSTIKILLHLVHDGEVRRSHLPTIIGINITTNL